MCSASNRQRFRRIHLAVPSSSSTSPQHSLQILYALLNLRLELSENMQDFNRRTMLCLLVNHFLVAVERQIIALRNNIGFRYAKALCCAGVLAFTSFALRPPR